MFFLLLLAGLGWLAQVITNTASPDPTRLFEQFLPPHQTGPHDPFAAGEALLGRIARFGQRVTLVVLPTFLWFATRTFASMRTALNDIYDVSLRPRPRRHFLLAFLYGKLRDLSMVVMVLLLFLISTAISGGLVLLHSAAAARHFATECDRLAIHRGDIRLAALGQRIAEAAGAGWAALRSAAEPNEAALLALAREMCHDPPSV